MKTQDFYLVFRQSENGLHISQMDKKELVHELNNGEIKHERILNHMPLFFDGYLKEDGYVILHVNKVVVPKEVKTVLEYAVE